MNEEERERLKQKLMQKKAVPDEILEEYKDLKDNLSREKEELSGEKDAEIKNALSSLKKRAQKKY